MGDRGLGGPSATVLFCDEAYRVEHPERGLVIGRTAELSLDEANMSLHRRFLVLYRVAEIWWLRNVGSILTAEVFDADQRYRTLLRPSGCIPLSRSVTVRVAAGRSVYELFVQIDDHTPRWAASEGAPWAAAQDALGTSTVGRVHLTGLERLVVLALAEPSLRDPRPGALRPATTKQVLERLGWSRRRYHRRLDALCHKLDGAGVPGMRGSGADKAGERRARLVEYAIAAELVTATDLSLLDGGVGAGGSSAASV